MLTVLLLVVGGAALLMLLGNLAQCDARHPQAGTRCTMKAGHKWTSPVVQGMYHSDRRGRRWRA